MAEIYDVAMSVEVKKTGNKEIVTTEYFTFNNQTFAKMANLADKFYELIATLQKIKP